MYSIFTKGVWECLHLLVRASSLSSNIAFHRAERILLLLRIMLSHCIVTACTNVFQVIDYLAKKGYSRTEAMLRIESAHQEIDGRPPMPPLGEDARPKYRMGFGKSFSVLMIRNSANST